MLESALRSASTSVVFPAPDGATTTNRLPRNGLPAPGLERAGAGRDGMTGFALLNVLHLFAHLLDEDLELDRDARDLVRHGFRSERVRLAVQLLAEEVQALAACAALVEHAAEFRDVRDEARELLVHVDARRVKDDLLVDALVR